MKWAIVIVLVVALVALVLYSARTAAEMPPAPMPMPSTPRNSIAPMYRDVPTVTFERTAEETWRANVMRSAQDYARATDEWYRRRLDGLSRALAPTSAVVADVEAAQRLSRSAAAIAAAAPMETRAQLMFRVAFASRPGSAYPSSVLRTYDALVAAVRAPIDFRPELPVVPVVLEGVTVLEMEEPPT